MRGLTKGEQIISQGMQNLINLDWRLRTKDRRLETKDEGQGLKTEDHRPKAKED